MEKPHIVSCSNQTNLIYRISNERAGRKSRDLSYNHATLEIKRKEFTHGRSFDYAAIPDSIHLGRMIFTETFLWQSGFPFIEFPVLPIHLHHRLIMIRAIGWNPFLVQIDPQSQKGSLVIHAIAMVQFPSSPVDRLT